MKTLSVIQATARQGRVGRFVAGASFAALLAVAPLQAAVAQTAPNLGAAGSFGVLAGTAVTCTNSVVNGDVGIAAAGSAVVQTGCTINGSIHAGDSVAAAAYGDFLKAYADLKLNTCDAVRATDDTLAGVTLPPGVYCFDAAATLTGQLTLDGPSNGVWIFLIGTSGTGALTGTNFSVVMNGGGQPCNVYWRVAQAVTMTTSAFQGTILAGADSTFTGGSLIGRDLVTGATTMTGVTASACSPGTPPSTCKDFVTGGGWITAPDGEKGTFGVSGGMKKDKPWGHLTYVDHGSKGSENELSVKGTGVTSYTVVDSTTRHIEGTAEINDKAGTYQVDVTDNGEPGRDDTFSIQLSTGYSASGKLAGGNIQVHKKCRPTMCLPFEREDDDEGDGHAGEGHARPERTSIRHSRR
jgi:hypothetical protein